MSSLASFMVYSALFWGPGSIFNAPWTLCTAIETSQKLVPIGVCGEFRGIERTLLGSRVDFWSSMDPPHGYRDIAKTRCFCRFGQVSWAIAHCFGVPGCFLCSMNTVHGYWDVAKIQCFCRFVTLSWFIAHCFGVTVDFLCSINRLHDYRNVIKTRFFLSFRASIMGDNALF